MIATYQWIAYMYMLASECIAWIYTIYIYVCILYILCVLCIVYTQNQYLRYTSNIQGLMRQGIGTSSCSMGIRVGCLVKPRWRGYSRINEFIAYGNSVLRIYDSYVSVDCVYVYAG